MSQTGNLSVPVYEDAEDEKLMALYVQGDEVAFRELFLRYKGRVYGYLARRLSDVSTTDDLFQLVFLNLHRSRRLYDSKRLFSAWIFCITRNVIRDFLRQKRRDVNIAQKEMDIETILVQQEDASVEMQLEEAMKKVSPREREAIRLRFDKAMEFEEIARSLGTSEGNVRQVISRAIRKVREAFR